MKNNKKEPNKCPECGSNFTYIRTVKTEKKERKCRKCGKTTEVKDDENN